MIGNRTGQPTGEISMCRMEGQRLHHGSVEIFDVFGLGFVSASGIGIFAFRVSLGGSLGFEFGLTPPGVDCQPWRKRIRSGSISSNLRTPNPFDNKFVPGFAILP